MKGSAGPDIFIGGRPIHKTGGPLDEGSRFSYIIKDQEYIIAAAATSFVDKALRCIVKVVPLAG